MGLCTVQPITLSKLPNAPPFLPKPSLPRRQTPLTLPAALLSRSICLRNLSPRATTSEERSSGASQFFNEKRDGVIILEDVKADDNNEFDKTVNEDTKEELPVDGQGLSFDLLDKLNFDTDDTGSIVLYGSGALVALWLTSAVIGAIDSIPLFPKLLEVVGLAYTVWFSSRYLLFKQNRDELTAKIEELKEQIFGSEDN
ncbi:CURVATURE THYLAKOID 1D [Spatholobus suberectus]|nr:CURVATURE THYLAKOID 1D [Spatholobus suberectus]